MRNAAIAGRGDLISVIAPVGAGAAGSIGALWLGDKMGLNPKIAGALVAAGGVIAGRTIKDPMYSNALYGAGIGGAAYAGLTWMLESRAKSAAQAAAPKAAPTAKPKNAEAAELVTRADLQDGLAKAAEAAKQTQCDLLEVLRAEIRRVFDEQREAQRVEQLKKAGWRPPLVGPTPVKPTPPTAPRSAYGYEYRDADDFRDADEFRDADFQEVG